VHGSARNRLTVLTVLLFAAASLSHAMRTRGRRFALLLLVISAGIGFLAEAVGVATAVPFGHYTYAQTLGPRLLGVPLVIPLAWTMMAYPALLVGQRCAESSVGRIGLGAVALASWDVFLDPQMVEAGHWRFGPDNGATLNGIPLVNTAGWLLVAALLMVLLNLLRERPGDRRGGDGLPFALYLWTYASSLLANLVFFGRPGVALVGGLAMGVPVFLLVRALRQPER
jgi:putative membrane protein